MWSSTRILWDQQVMLMWLLLPPIFATCLGVALAAPFLVRKSERRNADGNTVMPKHILADV